MWYNKVLVLEGYICTLGYTGRIWSISKPPFCRTHLAVTAKQLEILLLPCWDAGVRWEKSLKTTSASSSAMSHRDGGQRSELFPWSGVKLSIWRLVEQLTRLLLRVPESSYSPEHDK